jgi:hypothetical protein
MNLDTPKAIIIAALIVSATIAFSISTPRYEVAGIGAAGVVRLDRQTGQIVYCSALAVAADAAANCFK